MKPHPETYTHRMTRKNLRDSLRHIRWLYLRQRLTPPALPRPVHFALVACLCMFALLPLAPHHPLAFPIVIGGGLSFALLLQGGTRRRRTNS